jgi:hypothetical protein
MKKLLFYRDFHGFTGGHLKVYDYFKHAKESGIFEASIHLTNSSLRDATNPWFANDEMISNEWDPQCSDALFIAGLDWGAVPNNYDKPIINLIQGIRHADPKDQRHAYLSRPATRICVSQEVADAIKSTGTANGPVITIPNGLSTAGFPLPARERDIEVLISGYKQPELASRLATRLEADGIQVKCLSKQLARHDYLSLVARAAVSIFLPLEKEGFYLPALEGMVLETLVVCPDCVGNRGFCLHEKNCLQPLYHIDSIVLACHDALTRILNGSSVEILAGGLRQARLHSLSEERRLFLEVLQTIASHHRI